MSVHCTRCGDVYPRDPALEVECPTCHRKVGQYCYRPSGHKAADIHYERDALAMERGFLKKCKGMPNPAASHVYPLEAIPVEEDTIVGAYAYHHCGARHTLYLGDARHAVKFEVAGHHEKTVCCQGCQRWISVVHVKNEQQLKHYGQSTVGKNIRMWQREVKASEEAGRKAVAAEQERRASGADDWLLPWKKGRKVWRPERKT